MSRGRVARVRTAFVHADRRKRCPASRLVIIMARLERIPLHSRETSIVIPGSEKKNPVRRTGTSTIWNSEYEASADHVCSQRIVRFKKKSGIGTIRNRNSKGKRPLRKARRP